MDTILLKQRLRSIFKSKTKTILGLLGLTIAITVFIIISQIVLFETSYDRYHNNYENIYRVQNNRIYQNLDDESAGCPPATGPVLKDEISEIIESARIKPLMPNSILEIPKENRKKHFYHNNLYYADNSIFEIFSINFISGNPENALIEINSAVVTKGFGLKYFGKADVLGEQFTCNSSEGKISYTISAVIENIPQNSYLDFDCLLSYQSLISLNSDAAYEWGWNAFNTFIKLKPGSNLTLVNKKLKDIVSKYNLSDKNMTRVFALQSLQSLHLHSNLRHEIGKRGNAFMIYILISIAIFILVIAWINYINISTAKSKKQFLEINVKKILGCSKKELFYSQLFETFVLNFIALIFSIVFIKVSSPLLNNFYNIELHPLSFIQWNILIGFTFFVSILSGIYPALSININRPLFANKFVKIDNKASFSRNGLVLIQFVISIVFIISTILVVKQLKYMGNKQDDLAIENIITIKTLSNSDNLQNSQTVFIDEVKKMPGIEKVCISTTIPGGNYSNVIGAIRPITKEAVDGIKCSFIDANEAFFDLYKIDLLAGQNFRNNYLNSDRIIINSLAAKMLGYENPTEAINQKVVLGEMDGSMRTIIGVVADYHQKSLQVPIEPTIFNYRKFGDFISVKYHSELSTTIVGNLKVIWDKILPDQPFEYNFNDEFYSTQYSNDKLFGKLVSTFSVLIIFISCIGLYSLSRFSINTKIKEIGIRKVNGAKVAELIILLTSGFIKWIVIALFIACPIGWYIMNKWLANFAYRTEFNWWIFFLAGFITLIIAITTILLQTWKAANRNPVEALRYE